MKIAKSITDLIGHTPLLELTRLEEEKNLSARLLGKLEYFNPAGSVKDRIAKAMIEDAEEKGLLQPGSILIEPTSGNTGIGLAAVAASKGYKVILTMPETMSIERRKLLKAYGAQVVLTEGSRGMKGAIEKANELAASLKGSFLPGQFENRANPEMHRRTTGPEIWEDTEGPSGYLCGRRRHGRGRSPVWEATLSPEIRRYVYMQWSRKALLFFQEESRDLI